MKLSFHRGLKRWLIEAFSSQQTTPDQIARYLSKAMKRPCGKSEGEAFLHWLDNRDIKRLVHFTPLENVPKIMRYGLIPRDYLQLEILQLALGAQFTDDQRLEELPQYNCLSITSPNYGMFYGKRCNLGGRWAVIDFDPCMLACLYFDFTPTNAAAAGVSPLGGVRGAERLFMFPECRANLNLMPHEPTDPQAEALCDSILTPDCIRNVYVEHAKDADWLERNGIMPLIDRYLFMPRKDWKFWKGKRITELPGTPEDFWLNN
jgi:hypothetical protein